MEFFDLIKGVTSGLSLVAFVVAAVLTYFRYKLKQRENLIRQVRPQDKLKAIEATADIYKVDLTGLSPDGQKDILLTQLRSKAELQSAMVKLSGTIALILGVIAVASIVYSSEPALPLPQQVEEDTVRPAVYTFCVGQRGDRCPDGANHLACGESLASWAKANCPGSFELRQLRSFEGDECGYVVTQVICKTAPPDKSP